MARETDRQKLIRLTQIETGLWDEGLMPAGIDEVGRGPLAGPVVTCCVSIPRARLVPGVDDSKKVSEKKREILYEQLLEAADQVGFGWKTPAEIDEMNILNATKRAMEDAARSFTGFVFLVDAVEGIDLPGEACSIIHGDALSYMIGAAPTRSRNQKSS